MSINILRLSTYAMATRFELLLYGEDQSYLRAAGEEAFEEIEQLDRQLSLYRSESDIVRINSRAAVEPVRVELRLFKLLERAAELSEATDGAFDITIAPLMRAWGLAGGGGRVPDQDEIDAALARIGMKHVRLNPQDHTVSFDVDGVELDLGAIGKGYAIERAVESLRDNGITHALLHGGTSTIYAIGTPPDAPAWKVAIRNPVDEEHPLDVVDLVDNSLSVSAVHGKSFIDGTIEYGHIIDPRDGRPVQHTLAAAVVGPSPTDCDALSTALLVLGEAWLPELAKRFEGYRGRVISRS